MPTFAAVGDVGPESPDPDFLFDKVRDVLNSADLTFCQLEMNLTTAAMRVPQVRHTAKNDPGTAFTLARAGFDVVSWASNHCMDWGVDGFSETIDSLQRADMTVIGVGANLTAAREIRVEDVSGVKVAFVAACSILPADYWATERRPGCVPMRALTHYDPIEPDQPGTPCRIRTFPHPEDLANLLEDITTARGLADVVVVSLHWGIHFVPAQLADYQRAVAHAAVDAGADIILGHHAHILKGIEVYRGKSIFYSLGNFAMELPMTEEHASRKSLRELLDLHPGWEPNLDSRYNFPEDSKKSVIVTCEFSREGISKVSFLPVHIGDDAVPEILHPADPRFTEVVEYLSHISLEAGLSTRFDVEESTVTVSAGQPAEFATI